MHRGLPSAASFGRELVAPLFASPEIERAFIVQSFSESHITTMMFFSILNVMQVICCWFVEDDVQRRRLYPLIIGMMFIIFARHQHTPSHCPDQVLAHRRFSMWAALTCAMMIPMAKALAPEPNMPVLVTWGVHLVAIMTVRLHHYFPLPRVIIHASIFAADMEGSRWLTTLALGCGELVGGIFAREKCIAFHKHLRDIQLIQRSRDEAEQRLREELREKGEREEERKRKQERKRKLEDALRVAAAQERKRKLENAQRVVAAQEQLLEALRASNERREYEIRMIQQNFQKMQTKRAAPTSTWTSADEDHNQSRCSHETAKVGGAAPWDALLTEAGAPGSSVG